MDRSRGRITGLSGGLYTIRLDDGEIINCRARGVFRHEGVSPLVGDVVTVERADGQAVIQSIDTRKNALIRPPVANLDIMFVGLAAAKPEPSEFTTDKLISICEYNDITPVVLITKSELNEKRAEELEKIYRLAGYDVFVTSSVENTGIETLKNYLKENLPDKIAAFSGVSGAGKSTLMNKLFPELSLETGEISRKISRGKNTTRQVTLYEVYGGYLADTPGFSMIDFERFDFFGKDDLAGTFREFSDCLGRCRYTDCTHLCEEGCAVIEKMNEGKIAPSRHQSYTELYKILKEKHDWDKK